MKRTLGASRPSLRAHHRLLSLLVLALPPVVLAGMASRFLVDRLDITLRASAPLAQGEASRALGRDVRIGQLTPGLSVASLLDLVRNRQSLGTIPIEARDVAVAADPDRPFSKGGEALVRADKVIIALSVPALLTGDVSGAFPVITVQRPRALVVRDRSGRFNVADVLKPRTPPRPDAKPFRAQIRVENGALTFRDFAARLPGAARVPATNFVSGLNATADLRAADFARFDARGAAAPNTVSVARLGGPFAVTGAFARTGPGSPGAPAYDPDAARLWFTLRARNADAPYWLRYLFTLPPTGPRVTTGRANEARVSLVFPRLPAERVPNFGPSPAAPPVRFSGTLRLSGVRVANLPRLRPNEALSAVAGNLAFDEITLHTSGLRGTILGAPFSASGDVTEWRDAAQRRITLNLDAPRVPVARVLDALLPRGRASLPAGVQVLPGAGSFAGTLAGRLNNPAFAGDVRLPGLVYQGQEMRDVTARNARYEGGTLALGDVSLAVAGGTFRGAGAVRFAQIAPDGTTRVLPADQLAADVSGTLSGANLSRLRLAPLRRTLAAAGPLSGQASLDLVASVRGGRVANAAVNVRVANARARGLSIADARARVLVQNGRVVIPALALNSSFGVARVSGGVGTNGALDLSVFAAGLDVGKIARLIGRPAGEISGVVYAAGRVTGTLTRPSLVARVRALQPAFRNYRADTLRGAITLSPDRLIVGTANEPLVMRALPLNVAVTGSVGLPGAANGRRGVPVLDVVARLTGPVEVSEVVRLAQQATARPGAPAPAFSGKDYNGLVSAGTVYVGGTTASPRVRGAARLANAVVAGVALDRSAVRFTYDKNALAADATVTRVGANAPASQSRLGLRARLDNRGRLSGTFGSEGDLDLALLAPLTQDVAPITGSVRLEGTVGGTTRAPVVNARLTQGNAPLRLAGVPVSGLSARLFYDGEAGRARVSDLRVGFATDSNASGGEATALRVSEAAYSAQTGRFSAALSGSSERIETLLDTIAARVAPRLADAQTGAALTRQVRSLQGVLRGGSVSVESLRVAGRLQKTKTTTRVVEPEVRVALSGRNVRVAETVASTFSVRASLLGDILTINEFEARNDPEDTTITLSGRANLDPEGVIDPARPLVLQTNNGSLGLINAFFPGREVKGRADLTVVATGRTRAPRVEASLDARDVALAGRVIGRVSAPLVVLAPRENTSEPAGDAGQTLPRGQIAIVDRALLLQGDNRAEVTGTLPFSYAKLSLPRDEPINVTATLPSQDLDLLLDLAGVPGNAAPPAAVATTLPAAPTTLPAAAPARTPISLSRDAFRGQLEGAVNLGGTLDDPKYSGALAIVDGQFLPPREPGQRGDRINPVRDLDARFSFAGDTITIDQFALALGGPGRPNADFGTLNLAGTLNIKDLSADRVPVPADNDPATPDTRLVVDGGKLDLTATLNRLRIAEDNLIGGDEQVRGEINGALRIRGALAAPAVTTAGGPLTLANVFVQLPRSEGAASDQLPRPIVNPTFNVPITVRERAVITNGPGGFRVETRGTVEASGTLARPDVVARLTVLGGSLQLPTTRFTIQRGGTVFAAFRPSEGETTNASGQRKVVNASKITVSDLTARATVFVPTGIAPSLDVRASQGPNLVRSSVPPTGRTTRYRITVAIDGPVPLSDDPNEEGLRLRPTSDPPLSESQILALLGSQRQIEGLAGGDVQTALSNTFSQVLNSRLVPSLLSPIEQSLAAGLGLEEFGVEYNPDAPLTLRLSKRLPTPLQRFLLGYTRTLGTSGLQAGQPEPFNLSLTYEIGPRLQLGASSDEQRTYLFFLRGSLSF